MSEEFEKIQENVEEIKDEIRDEVNQAADAVEAAVNEAAEAVETEVAETVEEVKAEAEEAEQAVEDKKEEFKEKVDEVAADVKEAYANVKDKAQETFKNVKESATAAYATAKEKTQSTVEGIKKEIDDYSDEMDADDVSKNKVMSILAYLGPLVIIPLIAAGKSKFARFHTNQGLVLFLLGLVCWLLTDVKVIGWLFDICGIVVAILCVVGIIYAAQGKAKELPVVGNWKILK